GERLTPEIEGALVAGAVRKGCLGPAVRRIILKGVAVSALIRLRSAITIAVISVSENIARRVSPLRPVAPSILLKLDERSVNAVTRGSPTSHRIILACPGEAHVVRNRDSVAESVVAKLSRRPVRQGERGHIAFAV